MFQEKHQTAKGVRDTNPRTSHQIFNRNNTEVTRRGQINRTSFSEFIFLSNKTNHDSILCFYDLMQVNFNIFSL